MERTNFVQNIGSAFRKTSEKLCSSLSDNNLRSIICYRRVDELYRFLNSWVAHIYGDLDEEALKLRGFELIQHDTEWANNRSSSKVRSSLTFDVRWLMASLSFQEGGDIGDEIGEYTRESWEVSLSEHFSLSDILIESPMNDRRYKTDSRMKRFSKRKFFLSLSPALICFSYHSTKRFIKISPRVFFSRAEIILTAVKSSVCQNVQYNQKSNWIEWFRGFGG